MGSQTARIFGTIWLLISVVCTGKAISDIASAISEKSTIRIAASKLARPITTADLKEFGGADMSLDAREFALCKLKAIGKISTSDLETCYTLFSELDVTGDGVLNVDDILKQYQASVGDAVSS